MYIIVRKRIGGLKPPVQYYSNNGTAKTHFWSFTDRNAKLFDSLEEAQQSQSFAQEDDGMILSVMQWCEAMRQPDNVEIGTFSALLTKAQSLNCEVIY